MNIFKRIFEPEPQSSPIIVTSPPSKLPPALVGLLISYRYSIGRFGWHPGSLGLFSTLIDLANKGVIGFEESINKKDIIVKRMNGKKEYDFEQILISCIPKTGCVKINDFVKNLKTNDLLFPWAIKQEAINQGLFNLKISRDSLTDLGNESKQCGTNSTDIY